jgi:hypothetical protein
MVPREDGPGRAPTELPATAELVLPERVTEGLAETPDLFIFPTVVPTSAPRIAIPDSVPELVVEPGDTVIVRFDDNRIRRFRLSADTHRPEDGVVHINQPIGRALLGNGLEDEVEFVVDGRPRMVVVEKISRAAVLELAD